MTNPGALEVKRDWDADALETGDAMLLGAALAVVLWSEPDNVDAGPSPSLAILLAKGLADMGRVAFRSFGPDPALARRLGSVGSTRNGWRIMVADRPEAIVELFGIGWDMGWSGGLIGAGDERAFDLLAETWWRERTLWAGEVALAPVVDGVGMLLATPTATELDKAVQTILQPAIERGYVLTSR